MPRLQRTWPRQRWRMMLFSLKSLHRITLSQNSGLQRDPSLVRSWVFCSISCGDHSVWFSPALIGLSRRSRCRIYVGKLRGNGNRPIFTVKATRRPRPPSGELTEAAFYTASRLGSRCDVGALERESERQQHVHHLLAVARLLDVGDLAAAAIGDAGLRG